MLFSYPRHPPTFHSHPFQYPRPPFSCPQPTFGTHIPRSRLNSFASPTVPSRLRAPTATSYSTPPTLPTESCATRIPTKTCNRISPPLWMIAGALMRTVDKARGVDLDSKTAGRDGGGGKWLDGEKGRQGKGRGRDSRVWVKVRGRGKGE